MELNINKTQSFKSDISCTRLDTAIMPGCACFAGRYAFVVLVIYMLGQGGRGGWARGGRRGEVERKRGIHEERGGKRKKGIQEERRWKGTEITRKDGRWKRKKRDK